MLDLNLPGFEMITRHFDRLSVTNQKLIRQHRFIGSFRIVLDGGGAKERFPPGAGQALYGMLVDDIDAEVMGGFL